MAGRTRALHSPPRPGRVGPATSPGGLPRGHPQRRTHDGRRGEVTGSRRRALQACVPPPAGSDPAGRQGRDPPDFSSRGHMVSFLFPVPAGFRPAVHFRLSPLPVWLTSGSCPLTSGSCPAAGAPRGLPSRACGVGVRPALPRWPPSAGNAATRSTSGVTPGAAGQSPPGCGRPSSLPGPRAAARGRRASAGPTPAWAAPARAQPAPRGRRPPPARPPPALSPRLVAAARPPPAPRPRSARAQPAPRGRRPPRSPSLPGAGVRGWTLDGGGPGALLSSSRPECAPRLTSGEELGGPRGCRF
ncbi:proline-rich protein 2-like [Dasypus novemcinctus]|uniref:proline-rich protein 2-like n=1 Tax=Dasypus novemcinctus TaxID=9361 RepID=UPI0039C8CD0D